MHSLVHGEGDGVSADVGDAVVGDALVGDAVVGADGWQPQPAKSSPRVCGGTEPDGQVKQAPTK